MRIRYLSVAVFFEILSLNIACHAQENASAKQLQQWLKKYPAADTNGDGQLSREEAITYRNKVLGSSSRQGKNSARSGIKRTFNVDPGWDEKRFPEDAVCYKTPQEIKAIYEKVKPVRQSTVVSYPKPTDGALRVVGIGHSFMAPGYKTLPLIVQGAGMNQPLYTHIGGGMTGSARYKWEQENGIFGFKGQPFPRLMSSIANAEWDAMMFGPYYNDRALYYSCWIDFCLKYNPHMKFYLSDAWPQLEQLEERPETEDYFTEQLLDQLGVEKRKGHASTLDPLRAAYPGRIFVLPTSDAMVLAAKAFIRGEMPGIEGLHKVISKKDRSLWRDQLGHLGPGLERLEGYVFYATLYGRSPEKIDAPIKFGGNREFPSPELDTMFRKIAWQAVVGNPYSGVSDQNNDGLNDSLNLSN